MLEIIRNSILNARINSSQVETTLIESIWQIKEDKFTFKNMIVKKIRYVLIRVSWK